MKKQNLIIDLDGVTINTIKTIVEMYNEDHLFYKDFKVVDWHDVNTWEFAELSLEPAEVIDNYFCTPRFFQKVEFMTAAKWIIGKLHEFFDITFCSSGKYPNLQLKRMFVKKHFPYADFIPVELPTYPDKSHIDMTGAIFVDDCSSNLRTSNASIKICFGERYSWNEDWDGIRCANWIEIYKLLCNITKEESYNANLSNDWTC